MCFDLIQTVISKMFIKAERQRYFLSDFLQKLENIILCYGTAKNSFMSFSALVLALILPQNFCHSHTQISRRIFSKNSTFLSRASKTNEIHQIPEIEYFRRNYNFFYLYRR